MAGGWGGVTVTGEVELRLEIELEGSDTHTEEAEDEEGDVRKVKRGAGDEEGVTARPGLGSNFRF